MVAPFRRVRGRKQLIPYPAGRLQAATPPNRRVIGDRRAQFRYRKHFPSFQSTYRRVSMRPGAIRRDQRLFAQRGLQTAPLLPLADSLQ